MNVQPAILPPLDPGFIPAVLWNRAYRARCGADPGAHALAIAIERTDGTLSRFDTIVLSHNGANLPLNRVHHRR